MAHLFISFFLLISIILPNFNLCSTEQVYTSKTPFCAMNFCVADGQFYFTTQYDPESSNVVVVGRTGVPRDLTNNKLKDILVFKSTITHIAYLGLKIAVVNEASPQTISVIDNGSIISSGDLIGSDNNKIKSIIGLISNMPSRALSEDQFSNQQFNSLFVSAINSSNKIDIIVVNIPISDELTITQDRAFNTNFTLLDPEETVKSVLHWEQDLGILYISIQSTKTIKDKIINKRILISGFFDQENKFGLHKITANELNNSIYNNLDIQHLSTMFTTTHLNYLILASDKVYALPIVSDRTVYHKNIDELSSLNIGDVQNSNTVLGKNKKNITKSNTDIKITNSLTGTNVASAPKELKDLETTMYHGVLATKRHAPYDLGDRYFNGRAFIVPAQKQEDLYNIASIESQVGGNITLPGIITHIQVNSDTVIVSTNNKDKPEDGGIFASRAVFNSIGEIKAWTEWRRVCPSARSVLGFGYDSAFNIWWYLPINKEDNHSYIISRSNWNREQIKVIEKTVSDFFNNKDGGIFFGIDLFNFIVFAGKNKLVLFNSSNLSNKIFENMSKVNSAVIVKNGTNSWLAINSSKGLEILADQNGYGWDNSIYDNNNKFEDISELIKEDQSFILVNSYQKIKRLQAFQDKLYVLTSHKLDVLDINSGSIKSGKSKTKILIQDKKLYFYDFLVTSKFILLASNKGLFRLYAGKLEKIELPEQAGEFGAVHKIEPVTISGMRDDSALDGNIYILNADKKTEQGQIYRFSWNKHTDKIELLPDYFINKRRTFFQNLGDYRLDFISTNISNYNLYLNSKKKSISLEIMSPFIKSGERISDYDSKVLELPPDFKKVRGLFQEIKTGSLMAYGDFGLITN